QQHGRQRCPDRDHVDVDLVLSHPPASDGMPTWQRESISCSIPLIMRFQAVFAPSVNIPLGLLPLILIGFAGEPKSSTLARTGRRRTLARTGRFCDGTDSPGIGSATRAR